MKINKSLTNSLVACLLLAAGFFSLPLSAATIGYTNGNYGGSTVQRLGTSTTQGMAMKLSGDKLKALQGRTISAIEAVFGTRNTTGNAAHLFVTTQLGGTPVAEQDVTITRALRWYTFDLDQPYTITGQEEALYIGYTVEASKDSNPLSLDKSADMQDACFGLKDGAWTDFYGTGFGCVNVRAVIAGDFKLTDVMLKPFALEGYYKAGTSYSYSGAVLNFGTETVNSFDITLTVGNDAPQTFNYTDLNLASGETFDFTLPEYTATEVGKVPMTIEVSNVNGAADGVPADNSSMPEVFYYPANMERCLLLEGFTGQSCPNCPAGHRTVASVLATTDYSVAEVMHHSGNTPDIYTMDGDMNFTFFFGGTSTWAPAVMINRTLNPAVSSVPPLGRSGLNEAMITNTLDLVAGRQPYVSLSLTSDYDAATRQSKIVLKGYVHNDLPASQNLFNVVLAQDKIYGYQSNGGSMYEHSMVYRGDLTGNAWGITVPADKCKAGSMITWETTYTLPEAIVSDYYTDALLAQLGYSLEDITIPTDPENMYVTAYVGAFNGTGVDGNEVYNCVQVKLGDGYAQDGIVAAIASPETNAKEPVISVEGRRITVNGADSYAVYNAAGQRVPAGDVKTAGLYIVRTTAAGRTTARKIVVR